MKIINIITSFLKKNKDFSIFSLMSIASILLSAIYPFLIAKFLSLEGFAIFSTNKMFTRFYMIVLLAPSIQPFILFAQRELLKKGNMNRTVSLEVIIYLFNYLLLLTILLIFKDIIKNYIGLNDLQHFLMIFFLFFLSTKELLRMFLLSREQRIQSALMEVINNIVLIIYIVVQLFYKNNYIDMTTVIGGYTASAVISTFIGLLLLEKKDLSFKFNFNKERVREFLRFTSWQTFGFIGVFLLAWGDNIVLKNYVSNEELGSYNFAYGIFAAAVSVGQMISRYFLTKILKILDDGEKLRKYNNSYKPYLTVLYSIITLVIIFLAPFLIQIVYGNKYDSSFNSLTVLLITSILVFFNSFNNPLLEGKSFYKFQQINNIITVSINILLNVILIQYMGMIGAAIGTLIAYTYQVITIEIFVRKNIKLVTS